MSNLEKKIIILNIKDISLEYILSKLTNGAWSKATVAKSRYSNDFGGGLNEEIRKADVAVVSDKFFSFLNIFIEPHVLKYAKNNNINLQKNLGYTFVRYSKGDFFADHVDSTKEFPRKVSIILYLNDDYEGGSITFTKINKTFKPQKNSLFIFPSNENFSHSANPVIDGTKYVVVGFWD